MTVGSARAGASGDVHRALDEALAGEPLRIVATLIRTTGDWDLADNVRRARR